MGLGASKAEDAPLMQARQTVRRILAEEDGGLGVLAFASLLSGACRALADRSGSYALPSLSDVSDAVEGFVATECAALSAMLAAGRVKQGDAEGWLRCVAARLQSHISSAAPTSASAAPAAGLWNVFDPSPRPMSALQLVTYTVEMSRRLPNAPVVDARWSLDYTWLLLEGKTAFEFVWDGSALSVQQIASDVLNMSPIYTENACARSSVAPSPDLFAGHLLEISGRAVLDQLVQTPIAQYETTRYMCSLWVLLGLFRRLCLEQSSLYYETLAALAQLFETDEALEHLKQHIQELAAAEAEATPSGALSGDDDVDEEEEDQRVSQQPQPQSQQLLSQKSQQSQKSQRSQQSQRSQSLSQSQSQSQQTAFRAGQARVPDFDNDNDDDPSNSSGSSGGNSRSGSTGASGGGRRRGRPADDAVAPHVTAKGQTSSMHSSAKASKRTWAGQLMGFLEIEEACVRQREAAVSSSQADMAGINYARMLRQRAVDLNHTNYLAHYHLAETYFRLAEVHKNHFYDAQSHIDIALRLVQKAGAVGVGVGGGGGGGSAAAAGLDVSSPHGPTLATSAGARKAAGRQGSHDARRGLASSGRSTKHPHASADEPGASSINQLVPRHTCVTEEEILAFGAQLQSNRPTLEPPVPQAPQKRRARSRLPADDWDEDMPEIRRNLMNELNDCDNGRV
eukprot:m.110229 g.110229  ORF g.110229 m.110229 type:complete len:681 (+) comp15910_c0_seq1:308-2350(+)